MFRETFDEASRIFDQAGSGASGPARPLRSAGMADGATTEVALLGGFRLTRDGADVSVGSNGQRLLTLLACRPGPVLRRQVACLLWPDTSRARAFANLRMAVHRLERSCPGVVTATNSYLSLTREVWVDLTHADQIARQVLCTTGALHPVLLAEALRANWYDDLLPEWDQEWLVAHRARYQQLRLATLEKLAQRLSATGNHGAAVHAALTAVHADSLRDSAHKTLVEACLAQGNRHEALTHFAEYQRIFRDRLGMEPAGSINQLLRSA